MVKMKQRYFQSNKNVQFAHTKQIIKNQKKKPTKLFKKKIIAYFLDKRKLIPNKNEEMKKDQPQNKQKYYCLQQYLVSLNMYRVKIYDSNNKSDGNS